MKHLRRFFRDQDGAEILEYAIIILVVCVIAVGLFALIRTVKAKLGEAEQAILDISLTDGD